ncbi:ATP-binding protein [Sanguibacter sp. 4.1]|uniref:ATP-binding protein n=1 Tax=Sanguibacter biliveldensis TaxID=3030830 RepID=A0AAF0Z9I1_9MICO|nr:ATP-binding protein [Sanguibacter sp. 4.1]WPF83076.1 ATP-binding protein [Sanguibacter sp. 4.1]
MADPLFESLFAALEANPTSTPLRLQVARLLLDRGRLEEATTQAATALAHSPGDTDALALLTEATTAMRAAGARGGALGTSSPSEADHSESAVDVPDGSSAYTRPPVPGTAAAHPVRVADDTSAPDAPRPSLDFDWNRAESEVGESSVPPPFVDATPPTSTPPTSTPRALPVEPGAEEPAALLDVDERRVTLDDVGGLETVKRRLRESFLEPMRHPELAKAFGKTLRGGLVLYGPPGCGKTYMARAIAGELGARFLTVNLTDILAPHFGQTERNLHALFERARSLTPAVLFLDEIDAIGAKRSSIGAGWSGMRAMVDQLLMELDSMEADNDGLFVLAATNSPWDVDPALLRPGRFDRMLLVLPPDEPARDAILRMHLERRPVAGIDVAELVRSTAGFSGADLEHLVASAAEQAMMLSIRSGEVQPITMTELRHVLGEVRPSTGAWLASAKNVVAFANTDGRYDDLAEHLAERKRR